MPSAVLQLGVRALFAARLTLAIAAAVLLTAGSLVAMASDLERSFPEQVGQTNTTPSGRHGVVTVEAWDTVLASAR